MENTAIVGRVGIEVNQQNSRFHFIILLHETWQAYSISRYILSAVCLSLFTYLFLFHLLPISVSSIGTWTQTQFVEQIRKREEFFLTCNTLYRARVRVCTPAPKKDMQHQGIIWIVVVWIFLCKVQVHRNNERFIIFASIIPSANIFILLGANGRFDKTWAKIRHQIVWHRLPQKSIMRLCEVEQKDSFSFSEYV